MPADTAVTEPIPAQKPAITATTPEVNPLVDALNKLSEGQDARMKEVLETNNKQLADAMAKQTEALMGFASQLQKPTASNWSVAAPTAPVATSPPAVTLAPGDASKGVDMWPIMQRMFNDLSFRDKVVALHKTFPANG